MADKHNADRPFPSQTTMPVRLFDRREAIALLSWPSPPLARPDLDDLTNDEMLEALIIQSGIPSSEIRGVIDRPLACK